MGVLVLKLHPSRAQGFSKLIATEMHNSFEHLNSIHREVLFLRLSLLHLKRVNYCAFGYKHAALDL